MYLLLVAVRFFKNVLKDLLGFLNLVKFLDIIVVVKCIRNVLNYFFDCIFNILIVEYIVNILVGIFIFYFYFFGILGEI